MPLVELPLPTHRSPLPGDVRAFLREAERRIDEFQETSRIAAFVPSNFEGAYQLLAGIADADLARGRLFCEWGSGFGVVAGLAAWLDFDACGIEIESELVEAAQQLADDFSLPVQFLHGSFIPAGATARVEAGSGFAWLTTDAGDAASELGLAPDDFDVIFAYPWPDEQWVTLDLFERYAAVGALLVTFNGGDEFHIRRKTATRRR